MAWLQKRGGVWWIGWRTNGVEYRKSTGEADRTKAKAHLDKLATLESARRANALTEDFFRAATGKVIAKETLADFCKRWLADCASVTTASTMNKYKQVVREFLEDTKASETGLLIEDVGVNHISDFLTAKRLTLAPGTVKGYKRILSSIFLLAQNQGKIKGNPVALAKSHGKGGDAATTAKRPFTLAELATLHKRATPFWQGMIVAGYFTGQSLGDLITLRAENADLTPAADAPQGKITLNRRKTGKQVIIPLTKPLRAMLDKIWPADGRGFFWPTEAERYQRVGASPFSQEFYELMAGAGLVAARDGDKKSDGKGRDTKRTPQKLGFHNIRHTFVTHLKIGGAMDSTARELAGHSSTAISTVYTHLPMETLSKAVTALPEFNTTTTSTTTK